MSTIEIKQAQLQEPASGYEAQLQKLNDGSKFNFPLPTSKALFGNVPCSDQGWKFDTEVKEATIKAAGNGRYCAGGVEIKSP